MARAFATSGVSGRAAERPRNFEVADSRVGLTNNFFLARRKRGLSFAAGRCGNEDAVFSLQQRANRFRLNLGEASEARQQSVPGVRQPIHKSGGRGSGAGGR